MNPTTHTHIGGDITGIRRPFVIGVALAATLTVPSLFGIADPVAGAVATDSGEAVSWLLDGRAFERAVNEAIESFTNGAALLDRFEFEEAVARALAADAN